MKMLNFRPNVSQKRGIQVVTCLAACFFLLGYNPVQTQCAESITDFQQHIDQMNQSMEYAYSFICNVVLYDSSTPKLKINGFDSFVLGYTVYDLDQDGTDEMLEVTLDGSSNCLSYTVYESNGANDIWNGDSGSGVHPELNITTSYGQYDTYPYIQPDRINATYICSPADDSTKVYIVTEIHGATWPSEQFFETYVLEYDGSQINYVTSFEFEPGDDAEMDPDLQNDITRTTSLLGIGADPIDFSYNGSCYNQANLIDILYDVTPCSDFDSSLADECWQKCLNGETPSENDVLMCVYFPAKEDLENEIENISGSCIIYEGDDITDFDSYEWVEITDGDTYDDQGYTDNSSSMLTEEEALQIGHNYYGFNDGDTDAYGYEQYLYVDDYPTDDNPYYRLVVWAHSARDYLKVNAYTGETSSGNQP